MLRALYDYAMSHPDIRSSFGCSLRTVKYVVELDGSGGFLGIRKSEVPQVLCPDMGSATRGGGRISNVLMDKAVVSIRLDSGAPGDELSRIEGKRACFLDYFRDGLSVIPEFQSVLTALTDDKSVASIQDAAILNGVAPGDVVGFSVCGRLLSDLPSVRAWWAARQSDADSDCFRQQMLDIVTGECCQPVRISRLMPVKSAGGGQSGGVAFVTFDKASFCSYGQSQCYNAPMSRETSDAIVDALTYLGAKAPKLADYKFVHWYSHDVQPVDDVLNLALFDGFADDDDSDLSTVNVDAMSVMADKLVRSPFDGTCPASLQGHVYHIMILAPNGGRMGVHQYMTGSYDELYANIRQWFCDMSLVSADGRGLLRLRKMQTLLLSLLSKAELDKKTKSMAERLAPLSPYTAVITRACIFGDRLPMPICNRAISGNLAGIYRDGRLNPVSMQWLKLYVCREERREGKCMTMPELNREHESVLYHCGRLMAAYEQVQRAAMPDVKDGVLTRFYSACSQTPGRVLGMMQSMSVYHFDKIKIRCYAGLLSTVLEEIWSDIKDPIPDKTRLQERAYFALGYWQQRADLHRRIDEMWAELKAKKQEKQENQVEEDESNV